MQDKQHHDLLFNSKEHTINILNISIIQLKTKNSDYYRYICMSIYGIIRRNPFNLMLGSLQEDYDTITTFVNHWYFKIYKKSPIETKIHGIFGTCANEENTNKRIEFLEQIIKQLNKPSKNKKS